MLGVLTYIRKTLLQFSHLFIYAVKLIMGHIYHIYSLWPKNRNCAMYTDKSTNKQTSCDTSVLQNIIQWWKTNEVLLDRSIRMDPRYQTKKAHYTVPFLGNIQCRKTQNQKVDLWCLKLVDEMVNECKESKSSLWWWCKCLKSC